MPFKDKQKKREYQLAWMHARRAKIFDSQTCAWCGTNENLELHHINPEEKEGHRIWSWSWERILEEVDKCIIVCDPCHNNFHGEEKRLENYHGTGSGYYKYKCKCEHCKDWKRQVDNRYRNKYALKA